ncbi:MAG: tetratricopeptide repeat protein [Proteobacteria bacterium]|nr:tetratricopeptide repeat protein [Pseudomonadota bacterium]
MEKIDECGMMEKYLHSQGAILYDEKRFDEAIVFFQKAIELDDQPYSHYHLSLIHKERMEFDKALQEIARAIRMSPSVPEYYHEMSVVWGLKGDRNRASRDHKRAVKIDDNYRRIALIRSSAAVVNLAFPDLAQRSCPILSCPAYCCHFTGEPLRHGVCVGAGKLYAIRKFLSKKALQEDGFMKKLSYNGEDHLSRLVPPNYILKEHGNRFVYYPGRRAHFLDRATLKDLPKGRDYQTLMWINEKASSCAFLHEKQCLIHSTGDETGLDSCKQFFCMTGFVFFVLEHLGVVNNTQLQSKTMGELNRIAVESLLILSKIISGSVKPGEMSVSQKEYLKRDINTLFSPS